MRDTYTSRILFPKRAKVSGKDERRIKFYRAKRRKRFPLPLKSGYHVLEFISEGVAAGLRIRLTGALSDCKEAATKMNKKLKSIALRITKYKLYLYLKANNGVAGAITNIRREKN